MLYVVRDRFHPNPIRFHWLSMSVGYLVHLTEHSDSNSLGYRKPWYVRVCMNGGNKVRVQVSGG